MDDVRKVVRKVIKEFITNDEVSLLRYFSMSDDEKKSYLPHDYASKLEDFIIEEDIDYVIESEPYEAVEDLEESNPELYEMFGEWLFKKIKTHSLDIYDVDYPAWSFFGHPEVVKNQWLIHFTDEAESVASDGFTRGVDEIDRLGLTTYIGEFYKKYGGYNFAYTLSDFHRYGYEGMSEYKYGNSAVIFRASGVKMWHHSDEENQVIFYGNTAKDIIPMTSGEESHWSIRSEKTNRVLFENDDLQAVVEWLNRNYEQYRKHL